MPGYEGETGLDSSAPPVSVRLFFTPLQAALLAAGAAEPRSPAFSLLSADSASNRSTHPLFSSFPRQTRSDKLGLAKKANSYRWGALWIHGHKHESFDYEVNGTRVVCNPRGYAPNALNPDFRPDWVVKT